MISLLSVPATAMAAAKTTPTEAAAMAAEITAAEATTGTPTATEAGAAT